MDTARRGRRGTSLAILAPERPRSTRIERCNRWVKFAVCQPRAGALIRYLLALSLIGVVLIPACRDDGVGLPDPDPVDPDRVRSLVVNVFDVGHGDAHLIVNGDSRVIIDGGRSASGFSTYIDEFELNGSSIEAVILSHTHTDHSSGLGELFRSERNIEIGYFFDNVALPPRWSETTTLRDSARARADRGELVYRDAADPCGDGSAICTLKLDGQARLHVMKPYPDTSNLDNGSIPVKLVGPDSASFTMWMAGDARHSAIEWFERDARYHVSPGMRVNVLKGQEHGDCRALPGRLLELTSPEWVTFSLAEDNSAGRVHVQAKDRLIGSGTSWYRTDRNGTITITSPGTPGGGYTIVPEARSENQDGSADDTSTSPRCT